MLEARDFACAFQRQTKLIQSGLTLPPNYQFRWSERRREVLLKIAPYRLPDALSPAIARILRPAWMIPCLFMYDLGKRTSLRDPGCILAQIGT